MNHAGTSTTPIHLTRSGVSVLLAPDRHDVPVLHHWGAALGPVEGLPGPWLPGRSHSSVDEPRLRGVVSDPTSGFTGAPDLLGLRPDAGSPSGAAVPWAPRLRDWVTDVDDPDDATAPATVVLTGEDAEAGWRVAVELVLEPEGLLRARTRVTNLGPGALVLLQATTSLPVPPRATELLDLTGRWVRERSPQRHAFTLGTHGREARHGRTGHDASLVVAAGTPGFGFGRGEVWAVHTAWSGDHQTLAERTPEGEGLLAGGELIGPGEVTLAEGEGYASPWLLASWSPSGLDDVAARWHGWLRRTAPLAEPRRTLVNTWEAAYFDHDLERLTALADASAAVGLERFVLDDGWFTGRRDDTRGLGDWAVDTAVWPQGLAPLIDHVRGLGMDFGIWVEPEMVNVDSDLVRTHPDWVLRGRRDLPPSWRQQQVLDLQVPGAYAHVRDAMSALLGDHDIAFVKWDHNRDLIDVARWTDAGGRPAVHGQTAALYRLLDELRAAHPGVEIESCASGGGRVDLEVLRRTDRVWPSDTIDALERQQIQRWTGLLVPPERIGSHVGGPESHTTGRRHRLGYRAASALLYHLGVEWDLSRVDAAERDELAAWIALHREVRPVVATGRLVHGDDPDPAVSLTGVVAPDRSVGWYVVATVASTVTQTPPVVLLPGLDPERVYRVRRRDPEASRAQDPAVSLDRGWIDDPEGVTASGAALAAVGVRLPTLAPESAVVLHVTADNTGG